jgi:hypothetical protein
MWTMLETFITMSLLIFCLTFLLVLRLSFLMDLTIAHWVLVHKRVVMRSHHGVRPPRVSMVFLLEVSILI